MATKRVKTGGRKKGVPNKINATVREMILNALDEVGGQQWLVKQATENPVAFMALLGKILPTQVNADIQGDVAVTCIQRIIIDPRNRDLDDQGHLLP